MRQRARAAPIARQVSPLAIGVQLQRLTARAAPVAVADDGGGPVFGMALSVGTLGAAQQGATCSFLIEVLNLIPGMSASFSATWDDMTEPDGPNGQFDSSGPGAAVFSAIDPMTGLTFYATLSDGEVLEAGGAECLAP